MTLISSQKQPASGTVVLFEQDGDPHIAVIQGIKNEKYLLYTERGRPLEMSAARLTVFDIRATNLSGSAELQQFLVSLKSQTQKIADSIDLRDLWQIVSESGKPYQSDELADLCFAGASPQQKLATKLRLISDRAYFKRDKDRFVARPANIVEELKKARQVQTDRQNLRHAFREFFMRNRGLHNAVPPEFQGLIRLLRRYAVGADLGNSEEKEARELTEALLASSGLNNNRVGPLAAYSLLEQIRIFGARTNPAWERAALPDKILYDSEDLKGHKLSDIDALRQDFTSLDVFTIDDISTEDMDDALSLESTDYGYRLGIHISDVSSEVPLDCRLESKIAQRLSSIYLPERRVHMFPEELSLSKFSLLQSERRRAMSLLVEISSNYEILKTNIVPSWIRVKRRWTYEHVDDLLENAESEINTFYEIAAAFEEQRIKKGAMHVQKTELSVTVDENGTVALKEIDEQSPARAIVAEMAVLMNRIVAEFCRDNRIPVIFRSQPESAEESEEESKPEQGRARDHYIRVRLKRSEVALQPRPHAGLGLDAYLQITSPIRRYVDLINQRQVIAFLAGVKLPYSREELENILSDMEEGLSKIAKVSKDSKRFWLLRYLEQRIAANPGADGRKIAGVVVRTAGKHPLVELDEVYFASFVKSARKLVVGEKVEVVIAAIDARDDYLRLEISGKE